jgi:hypothetical protein
VTTARGGNEPDALTALILAPAGCVIVWMVLGFLKLVVFD